MPTKTTEGPAFPCLACIREEGCSDNYWYVALAKVVIRGEVRSDELWALLRKREGQYGHGMIVRIITCMADDGASLDEKCDRVAQIIHNYGVPRSEDEHTCEEKKA